MEPKRLYRSITDRKVAGVAGGLAEYFSLDPLLFRLIFVVLTLAGGGGGIIYIVLWIITPERPYYQPKMAGQESYTNPSPEDQPDQPGENQSYSTSQPHNDIQVPPKKEKKKGSLTGGLVLITIGVLFLAAEFFPEINFLDYWPLILVVAGIGLLVKAFMKRSENNNSL